MIKAVLFDLDGTILDTLCDLAAAANYAMEKCNYKAQPVEKFKEFVGNGTDVMLCRAMQIEYDEREVKRVKEIYRKYYREHYCEKTAPFENIPEALSKLENMGIALGVVTNKLHEMAYNLVTENFPNKFRSILGDDGNYPAKPDPKRAVAVAKLLNVKPEECLFVGDSNVDVFTAQNFGSKSVGVLWGYRDEQELSTAGADYIVSNPEEIAEIVAKINKIQ